MSRKKELLPLSNNMVRIAIKKDDNGHIYVMPYREARTFDEDLEVAHLDYAAAFIAKYNKYMIGGSMSELELYMEPEKLPR